MCIFFFKDAATTEISPLPLPDPLPISAAPAAARLHRAPAGVRLLLGGERGAARPPVRARGERRGPRAGHQGRSEEHTSELQSRQYLVCRLLLEKKKN